jgi:hypothetical protein
VKIAIKRKTLDRILLLREIVGKLEGGVTAKYLRSIHVYHPLFLEMSKNIFARFLRKSVRDGFLKQEEGLLTCSKMPSFELYTPNILMAHRANAEAKARAWAAPVMIRGCLALRQKKVSQATWWKTL